MKDPRHVNLASYDAIVVSTSAGKDSTALLAYMYLRCAELGIADRIVVVHADLGRMEWPGTEDLARRQARRYGLRFEVVRQTYDLLDNVLDKRQRDLARGKDQPSWPGMGQMQRWCTSQLKTTPISKLITRLKVELQQQGHAGPARVLDCIGVRAGESASRAKAMSKHGVLRPVKSNGQVHVDKYYPIAWWTDADVWRLIRAERLPVHRAYQLGMPRLSCVFCIYASKEALALAAYHNLALLDQYCDAEEATGYSFTQDISLTQLRDEIELREWDHITTAQHIAWGDHKQEGK